MVSKLRGSLVTDNGLVDRRIFIDQDIYKQELEQIFGRCWLFIGHASQVSKPNDFVASYMGEDPILICRDSKNKLHAFLNMCRHRGNRICRADHGNSPSFMCTYHGWTFSTDGKLVGVPGYKEAYFEELDRSQWGLVEAAHLEAYKGLIFATWDNNAPSFHDYFGDALWYMDLLLDRKESGTEVLDGVHRWVIKSNWKFGADNFGGDAYHGPINHASNYVTGISRGRTSSYAQPSYSVHAGNGHGVLAMYNGPGQNPQLASPQAAATNYRASLVPDVQRRLGAVRGKVITYGVATMFPNFTWHGAPMVRAWHPRGPDKTEIWSYCIVEKDMPQDVRNILRRNMTMTFSAGGTFEQDDMNNWVQCTELSKSPAARKHIMNVQMGLGHETRDENFPGILSSFVSETNQRAFYTRWAEMMDASSWNDISIAPKSQKIDHA